MYDFKVVRKTGIADNEIKKYSAPAEATKMLERLEKIDSKIRNLHVVVHERDQYGTGRMIESFPSEDWKEHGEKLYSGIINAAQAK